MSNAKFHSALSHRSDTTGPQGLSIAIREISDRGMIDLRGDVEDAAFAKAVSGVLGVALPVLARTSTSKAGITVLWLSIDQWLITCPRDAAAALHVNLTAAVDNLHAVAVNMSDARAIIRLSGDGVREVIMKGAPVDLSADGYVAGTVRRMNFANVAALAHIVEEQPDTIDVYVFRSYADHAWEWLLATAGEASKIKLFGDQSRADV